MTQWYYVDSQQQRHGPVDGDAVAALFRDGTLGRASLVWREGMQEWTALINVAPELRLDMTPPSPPAPETADTPVATEVEVERPLTGRAVFTASEPSYAQPEAILRAKPAVSPGDSPYAAPRAEIGARAYGTPVQDGHVVYAGFWKRVAASVIDSLAIGIPVGIVAAILGGLAGGGFSSLETFNAVQTLSSYLLGAIAFAWFHSSAGLLATPGKLAVGIKVVRTDGDKITFLRGFGRYWAYLLSSLLLCIGLIMAAFTERKQGLHDLMCDTLVVDKWAFTSQPERQREELGTVTIVVLALFGLLLVGVVILAIVGVAALASMGR
jgi:uncharacterized RDD family membrane protein YckC